MTRALATLAMLLTIVVTPAFAGRYDEPREPDCYTYRDDFDCDRSPRLKRSFEKVVVWLAFVIVLPVMVYRLVAGQVRDVRLTDSEWLQKYPTKAIWERERERKLGIGFYFTSAVMVA